MTNTVTPPLRFRKMHGLGNDFVVLDGRDAPVSLNTDQIRRIGDRHRGVGFDQLAIITAGSGDAHLTFFNADGSPSSTCGNATRCIARLLMDETGADRLHLTSDYGDLFARTREDGQVSINMGQPQTDWAQIPLARAMDTLHLPLEGSPTATGMGNPHCSFFVADAEAVDLDSLGPQTEHDPLFPQRTNVQVVSVLGPDHLRMRVWERGVGITLASGSSSCAVAVAAARRGLTGRSVRIDLDGGPIDIDWRDDGVWMTGATSYVFDGAFTDAWLAGAP